MEKRCYRVTRGKSVLGLDWQYLGTAAFVFGTCLELTGHIVLSIVVALVATFTVKWGYADRMPGTFLSMLRYLRLSDYHSPSGRERCVYLPGLAGSVQGGRHA